MIILAYLHKILQSRVNFSRVLTKNTNCREFFDETLKILDENSIEKLTFKLFLEMWIFSDRVEK